MTLNPVLLLLLCGGYGGLFAALLANRGKPGYLPAKIACSTAFVALAFVFGAAGGWPPLLWRMLPAFFLCAAGDAALGMYNLYNKRRSIVVGMLCFLAGHGCFFAAFCNVAPFTGWELILPALLVAAQLCLLQLPKMHMGRLRIPGLVYCFAVSLMASKAFMLPMAAPGADNLVRAFGALGLLASDALLLFLYFYRGGRKNAALHIANLATYYGGMLLLAAALAC